MTKKLFAVSLALGVGLANLQSATLGTDSGSNYGTSWNNSSNFGTGFGAWDLWVTGTNSTTDFAGHFINGGRFGMYGNSSATTGRAAQANAQRLFDGGALAAGQAFLIDLTVDYRNGFKGIDLFSGSFSTVWNFNIGDNSYSPGGIALSNTLAPYVADSVFSIRADQLTAESFQVQVLRGGSTLYTSSSITGALNGFKLYVGQTDAGGQNNLFANNLQIIPEPSTPLLMGLGLAGLLALRKNRKA